MAPVRFLRCCSLVLLLVCRLSMVNAQNNPVMERMMTRRIPSCADITYNCSILIPKLHAAGEADTLAMLMDYWRNSCGTTSCWYAYKALSSIAADTFSERLYGNNMLGELRQYGYLSKNRAPVLYRQYYYYNLLIDSQYYDFISVLAAKLAGRNSLSPEAKLVATYYASPDDSLLKRIAGPEFSGTMLQQEYKSYERVSQRGVGTTVRAIVGVWIPTNALQIVGAHPFLGLSYGGSGPKLEIALTVAFKFIRAPNTYLVKKDDSVFQTTHFLGGYIGADGAYNLLGKGAHRLQVLGGIAYDGADVLSLPENGSPKTYTKSISSLNLNTGLGYRYWFPSGSYLGFEAKYNFINYKNSGGTDLSGNCITFALLVGTTSRHTRQGIPIRRY